MSAGNESWSSGESEPDEPVDSDMTGASEIEIIDIADQNEPNLDLHYDNYYYPSIKDFTAQASIRENISVKDDSSLDYFELFFDSSFLDTIRVQTNLYQEQHPEPIHKNMKPWSPVTENELRTFIGITINMGHVRKGALKDYWSKDSLLATPIFEILCLEIDTFKFCDIFILLIMKML